MSMVFSLKAKRCSDIQQLLLQITHYALRITHYALRITHYALRITHYALRITHSSSLVQYSIKDSNQIGIRLGAGQQPAIDVEGGAETDAVSAPFLIHPRYFGSYVGIS
jgi:hypothetical protein